MINILTRTSNRPKEFSNLIDNLKSQNCTLFNHIVVVDNKTSFEYVKNYEIENLHEVEKEELIKNYEFKDPKTGPFSPYNNYFFITV